MPDTFPTPRVWVAGERVTASKMNEISTALGVLYPFTAGGQIPYRDLAGNYLSALGVPSEDSFLKNTAAGVVSWLSAVGLPGRFHTYGTNYSDSTPDSSSSSYVDTGISVNLTLTQVCTIVAIAHGTVNMIAGTYLGGLRVVIDGTAGTAAATTKHTTPTPFASVAIKNGVAAGTRTVKLQYSTANPSDTISIPRGQIHAFAFVE